MKSLLFSIASLIAITPINQYFFNHCHATKSKLEHDQLIGKSLMNYQYGYLSNDDWITNQSSIDQKFYSYNTIHANYQLSNGILARTVFMVNTEGNLVYKPTAKIPDVDKARVDVTKNEMIHQDKKITTTENNNNPISNSQYSSSYFDTGFKNWQFLQLGGQPNFITLAGQQSAEKVQYYNNLSETLGLYYIAKAVRQVGGIDLRVAENLGHYFINHSSLKNKLNDDNLIDAIIKLISTNNLIYQFIYDTPFSNTDKLYSLNFIFNNNNQLVEIYYQKWNKINTNLAGYAWAHTYNTDQLVFEDSSQTYTWLDWSGYANDWESFVAKFPTFNFNQSNLKIFNVQEPSSAKSTNFTGNFLTSSITTKSTEKDKNINLIYIMILLFNDYVPFATFIINVWHDNQNIYFNWDLICLYNTNVSFKLGMVSFNTQT